MKTISTQKLSSKLAKYGALSVAIAGVADVSGQVVYTDVDPDFEGALTDVFDIDFDSDGTVDIQVVQSNNGNYELVQALPAAGNGVIAASANSGAYFYASNLMADAAIDGGAGAFGTFGSFCAGVGYAGSQFCGLGAGFAGVQFDISGETHYGWIRVDIASSSAYTVLDYAYEATPDTAIPAGAGAAVGIEETEFTDFNYFIDDSEQLNLNAESPMNTIQITDLLGKQVINSQVLSSNERIDLSSLTSGAYIVTVTINEERQSFKIAK